MTHGPVKLHPGSGAARVTARPQPWPGSSHPAAARRVSAYAGGTAAIIAAACYSSFLLSPWAHGASPAGNGFVSELEDPGQPFAWLYRGSDVLAGFGVLAAAWALHRLMGRRRPAAGLVLLALTGASSMLDAVSSMQCDPGTSARCAQQEHTALGLIGQLLVLHTDSGLLGFFSSAAGAAVVGTAFISRWPGWGRLQVILGISIAAAGLADLVLLLTGGSVGTSERARVLLTSGWFLIVGLFLLRQGSGHGRTGAQHARRIGGPGHEDRSRSAGQPDTATARSTDAAAKARPDLPSRLQDSRRRC